MKLVWILVAAIPVSCGPPSRGDACSEAGRMCGADQQGLECEDGTWRQICYACVEPSEEEIQCLVDICDPRLVRECTPANSIRVLLVLPKDGAPRA